MRVATWPRLIETPTIIGPDPRKLTTTCSRGFLWSAHSVYIRLQVGASKSARAILASAVAPPRTRACSAREAVSGRGKMGCHAAAQRRAVPAAVRRAEHRETPPASATSWPPAASRRSTLGDGGLSIRVRNGVGRSPPPWSHSRGAFPAGLQVVKAGCAGARPWRLHGAPSRRLRDRGKRRAAE